MIDQKYIICIGALLVSLSILTPSTIGQASSGGTWEGDETLRCRVQIVLAMEFNCNLNRTIEALPEQIVVQQDSGKVPPLPAGQYTRVTLTIEWEPVSSDADELYLSISGNTACTNTAADPSCSTDTVTGTSPLTVELYGAAAANSTIYTAVFIGDPCQYATPPSCRDVPLRVVLEQPYHWRWTFE